MEATFNNKTKGKREKSVTIAEFAEDNDLHVNSLRTLIPLAMPSEFTRKKLGYYHESKLKAWLLINKSRVMPAK